MKILSLLAAIVIVQDGGETRIRVSEPGQTAITLARIEAPKLTQSLYAVTGEVKYSGVNGDAYLETWNVFPRLGRAFSRTMAEGGPLGIIRGNSAWRPFVLPFDASGAGELPSLVEFGLVLPAGGDVALRNVRLMEFPPGASAAQSLVQPGRFVQEVSLTPPGQYLRPSPSAGAWWDARTGGLIGGIAGTLLGCIGGAMGMAFRRHRRAVIFCGFILAALGICVLIAGVAAVCLRQPYAVYYPLLLLGFLMSVIFGVNALVLSRLARQEELRRISAMDA